jgi:large subunit ribosomal protein L32e
MVINEELLAARKKVAQRRPKFIRQESWRYDRLAESWRKPKGKDNKMRLQKSGVPVLIHNTAELVKLDPKKDAARIGHTVGKKKRIEIINKAVELGIKVLNPGNLISKLQKEKEKKNG